LKPVSSSKSKSKKKPQHQEIKKVERGLGSQGTDNGTKNKDDKKKSVLNTLISMFKVNEFC